MLQADSYVNVYFEMKQIKGAMVALCGLWLFFPWIFGTSIGRSPVKYILNIEDKIRIPEVNFFNQF